LKYTNKNNIPEVFARYAKRNSYSDGGAEFTPSSLAEPAQIRQLSKQYESKLTSDISDDLFSILGSAIHSILEGGANAEDIVEERLFAEFDGHSISGCPDRLVPDGDGAWGLEDYKSTSVSTIKHSPRGKKEWTAQLSVYRWLGRENDMSISQDSRVVCIIRDWVRSQTQWKADYPKSAVIVIPITLWSYEETEAYMRDRIAALTAKEPAPCTPSERWQSDNVYAVHSYVSGGGLSKRAVKGGLHTSSYDAEAYILEQSIHGEVVERVGKPNRCAGGWCPVSAHCGQYQNEIGENEDGW
jgi:hypothetical protein